MQPLARSQRKRMPPSFPCFQGLSAYSEFLAQAAELARRPRTKENFLGADRPSLLVGPSSTVHCRAGICSPVQAARLEPYGGRKPAMHLTNSRPKGSGQHRLFCVAGAECDSTSPPVTLPTCRACAFGCLYHCSPMPFHLREPSSNALWFVAGQPLHPSFPEPDEERTLQECLAK